MVELWFLGAGSTSFRLLPLVSSFLFFFRFFSSSCAPKRESQPPTRWCAPAEACVACWIFEQVTRAGQESRVLSLCSKNTLQAPTE